MALSIKSIFRIVNRYVFVTESKKKNSMSEGGHRRLKLNRKAGTITKGILE